MEKSLVLVLMALFSTVVNAEGLVLSGKVGTLGVGLGLTQEYSDSFIGRLGFNTSSDYSANGNKYTVEYDSKMQLQTISALVDWYPMHSAFRATTGLYYNSKLSLTAQPPSGPYTIDGTNFTAAEMSSMQGSVSYNQVAPYIGLGWGNPNAQGKGWGLVSDFGLLIQGQPYAIQDATCSASANPTQCAALQSNQSNFKLYPVATVGVSYQW